MTKPFQWEEVPGFHFNGNNSIGVEGWVMPMSRASSRLTHVHVKKFRGEGSKLKVIHSVVNKALSWKHKCEARRFLDIDWLEARWGASLFWLKSWRQERTTTTCAKMNDSCWVYIDTMNDEPLGLGRWLFSVVVEVCGLPIRRLLRSMDGIHSPFRTPNAPNGH
jgi:hypothetical protein